ncbi:MAG: CatB-related O-acetyltransferase [Armatimonadetes bacterium]|nr:CatB-related O-acetyltransferase [Armatimonadota bacterium]
MNPSFERLLRIHPRNSLLYRLRKREFARRFPGSQISPNSVVPKGRITIGRGTYGCPTILVYHPRDSVSIGNYCSIGPEVLIITSGGHRSDTSCQYPFKKRLNPKVVNTDVVTKGPIIIGNDVWLGARSIVLSGVTVGDGALVAAGAIVVEDVPSFGVVGGNPARLIRMRFDSDVIAALLRIRWWNWPEDKLLANLDDLYLPVAEFVLKHDVVVGSPHGLHMEGSDEGS